MSEYIAAKTAIARATGPRAGPRTKAPTPANIKKIETIQIIAPNIVNIFFISFLVSKIMKTIEFDESKVAGAVVRASYRANI